MTSTLFIGDLSSLCGIDNIERLFSTCGTIVDIRLKYDELTKRQLSYGFVEFLNPKEAEMAIQNLNGYILRGRALRISWAFSKPSLTKERSISSVSSDATQPKSETATKSSIHVVFYTVAMIGKMVTEETLRDLFLSFGSFADVIVKKANKQNTINSKGYAFVHFADTDAGVASAMAAVREMGRGLVLDGVYYKCSLSRSFQGTMSEALTANRTAPQQYSSYSCPIPGTSPTGVDGVMFFPSSVRVGNFCGGVAGSPPALYTHQPSPPVNPVEWHHRSSVYATVPTSYVADQPVFCPAPAASYPQQQQQQHGPVYVDHRPVHTPMHYHHNMVQMTQGSAYYPISAPMLFPSQPHGGGPVHQEGYIQVLYHTGAQHSFCGDHRYHQ